jgi:transcriptional regulator with XRE-family HTH domain
VNINNLDIASRIITYINKRGITQKEFSKRANVSKYSLHRWIKEGKKINNSDLEKLNHFFNMNDENG